MSASDVTSVGPIRVLLAFERPATREAVRAALEPGGAECVEAKNGRDAIDCAVRGRVDVCLIDARMKGDGIAVASAIREQRPEARIVVLAPVEDEIELLEAVSAGAVGYMGDTVDPTTLASIVNGVVRGEAAVPRRLVARLIDELRFREGRHRTVRTSRGAVALTRREWQVLELLEEGCSTRDIAARLLISEVTVRRHVSLLLQRLEVRDRNAAVGLLRSSAGQ
jgi:DNA-binding NarL/FixJ family response regulator